MRHLGAQKSAQAVTGARSAQQGGIDRLKALQIMSYIHLYCCLGSGLALLGGPAAPCTWWARRTAHAWSAPPCGTGPAARDSRRHIPLL